jgi:hypothetical protein
MTLVVPPGAEGYPISHGTEQFQPYRADHTDPASLWLVDMPAHAAQAMIHNGGFRAMPSKPVAAADEDTVRLVHPEGARGCGWDGRSFVPDVDGILTVPAAAAAELAAHGFVPAPAEPAAKA